MTAFQRATTMAKRMPSAERSPSTAMGLPLQRIVPSPEGERMTGFGLSGKQARFPVRLGDVGETHRRLDAFSAKPRRGCLVHGIERSDLDANVRRFRHGSVDEFHVSDGRQKGCAATRLFFPAMARLEPQRGKKAREAIVSRCACGGAQKGYSFDHDLILSWGIE